MIGLTPAPDRAVRAIPLFRLGWVAWRRYRTAVAGSAAILTLAALFLVIDGRRMRSLYQSYLACRPVNSASCQFAWQNFRDAYAQPGLLRVVLLFLPGVIGAFAGAPVLAREFETGTFRFAWTQGVGRMRWAVASLVPGAVGVAGIMGAFGLLVSWHNRPLVMAGIAPRLRATDFPTTGLAAAGWALAGFALGVAAGLLWRRVIPALATALAAWFGLAILTASILRPNYLTPLTTTSLQQSARDLWLSQWWTKDGVRVSDADISRILQGTGFQAVSGNKVTVRPGESGSIDPVQYLLQHGYTQVTSFQPDSRYWPFQWIEFGWLAALSLLLILGVLWLLRRRAS